jgi:hypothetical protein
LPKLRIDVVVQDEDAAMVADAIAKFVRTGSVGDGKIWLCPVDAALPPDARPRGESLYDVTVRLLPYWCDAILPDLYRHAACWWRRTATRYGRW